MNDTKWEFNYQKIISEWMTKEHIELFLNVISNRFIGCTFIGNANQTIKYSEVVWHLNAPAFGEQNATDLAPEVHQ